MPRLKIAKCSHCSGFLRKNENLCNAHELQVKWYDILKQEGFDDIEQDEEHLKVWSGHFFKANYNETLYEAKAEYYRMAGKFLYDHNFETQLQAVIWAMHSEGDSYDTISAALKEKGLHFSRDSVQSVVKSLSKIMLAGKEGLKK